MTADIVDFPQANEIDPIEAVNAWSHAIMQLISAAMDDADDFDLPKDQRAVCIAAIQVAACLATTSGTDPDSRDAAGHTMAELFDISLRHFKAGGKLTIVRKEQSADV